MTDRGLLVAELDRLAIPLSTDAQVKLLQYLAVLARWNRTVNLTHLEGTELVRRLVAEPLWIAHQLQLSGRLADIGSGNGSPGIPLYLAGTVSVAHLVESRARRAAFLRQTVLDLGLRNVVVHHERVENLAPEAITPVDWIVLQAVKPDGKILKALKRLCAPTTTIVWVTSILQAPVPGARKLRVPDSTSVAWFWPGIEIAG